MVYHKIIDKVIDTAMERRGYSEEVLRYLDYRIDVSQRKGRKEDFDLIAKFARAFYALMHEMEEVLLAKERGQSIETPESKQLPEAYRRPGRQPGSHPRTSYRPIDVMLRPASKSATKPRQADFTDTGFAAGKPLIRPHEAP